MQRTPDTGDLAGWLIALPQLPTDIPNAGRIDRIRALEELKGAICAAQAREAVALKRSVIAAEAAQGVPVCTIGSTGAVARGMIEAKASSGNSKGWYMPAQAVQRYFGIIVKTV